MIMHIQGINEETLYYRTITEMKHMYNLHLQCHHVQSDRH